MGTGALAEDGDVIECRKDEEIMDTARKALEEEPWGPGLRGVAGKLEETVVQLVSPKLK